MQTYIQQHIFYFFKLSTYTFNSSLNYIINTCNTDIFIYFKSVKCVYIRFYTVTYVSIRMKYESGLGVATPLHRQFETTATKKTKQA